MTAIDRLSEEELLNRLVFLIEKVEWDCKEMQWLLGYLEQTDGRLLQHILYETLLCEGPRGGCQQEIFAQSRIKRNLDNQLFE